MDLHLLRTIGVDLSHDGSEIALSDEQTWSASAELEPNDFDEAQELPGSDEIIAARRALETCQPDHPDRAKRCLILSKLLYSLFKSTGNKGPLEETITLEREMLALRPREHPIHAKLCSSLAISLKKHYLRFGGSGAVLDEIISLHEVCLELRPHGDPLRDGTCVALAINLRQKYTVAGDPALLHRAMELIEEVIKLQPKGDPVRLTVRMEQAALLRALYFRSTDVQLLRKAVLLEREILLHYPPGHRRRAPNCGSLARSLNLLYNTGGPDTTSALDEAIELEKEVLVLCPPGHRLRHAACESISISLHKRAHVGSRGLADLEESILFAREALELRSPGHFARNASLVALAQVLRERYIRTGNIPDLDEVIALERQAIAAYPVGHTQRATAFVSLANSLRRSFDRTGDVRVLEEAYEHAKTGLGLRPSGHALRPGALIAVVVLLNTLSTIRSYRSDAFIHDAIAYGREATQLCPKGRGHAHRAPSCMGLAASLKLLFGRTGDEVLLHEAIALETEALELRLPDDIDRPTSCTNLAVSLNMLHEHNPTLDLQDRIIALEKEALLLRRPKDPLRAAACTNLASSLRKRFMLTKDTSFLKTATDLDIEALNIQSPDHPRRLQLSVDLSISYTKWYEVSLDKTHLAAAIATCKQGLASTSQSNPARWRGSLQLAQLLLFETSTFDADAIIPLMSEAANPQADDPPALLAGLAHIISLLNLKLAKEADLLRILQVHDQIIGLMPLVAGHTLDARNQLQVTKSCAEIGRAAFACAARAGQVTQGLALIERARGVMWSQALKLRDPQINTLPKAQGNELTSLISSLSLTQKNQLSTERIGDSDARFLTNRDVRHVQGRRLQTLIEEIRGIPGQEMFMHGLPITTLLQASARHPVVVLVPALDYCRALILHSPNDVVMLPFPEVKIPDLWTMVLGATCDDDQGPGGLKGRQRGIKVISGRPKDTLSQLWVRIVKPIVLQLGFKKQVGEARPRLHWCPTGDFMFLPVHAAGIHHGSRQERCSDYVVSSYTPTVTALHKAQLTSPILLRDQVAILVIAEKDAPDMPPLSMIREEVKTITDVARQSGIVVNHAASTLSTTVSEAAAGLSTAQMVHFACHGLQNVGDPLESGFHLHDGRLTVSQLMQLNLKSAFLAILSACETARGDWKQPDQTVHLAAAMLFSGFRHVLGTMWEMHDVDGPVLAKLMYSKLFANESIDDDAIAYALDAAVSELRRSGARPERWATFIHMGA